MALVNIWVINTVSFLCKEIWSRESLANNGMLQSLEQLMNIDDIEIRSVIVDIICCVVDCNPSMVRDYLCKEGNTMDEDSMLLNMLIDMLLTSADNGMGVILMQLIRNLLDPENMGLGANKMEKSEFLSFFYRHCMHVLTAPIFAVTANDAVDGLTGKDDFSRATILDYVIDILTFCVEHHSYHIKNFVISKDMLRRVLVLMQSKHKFLALAALKFTRRIIGIKDEMYNKYISLGKLLMPVVKAFLANGYRYNLVNSAIIELFEFIRAENISTLCNYVVENHIDAFKDHSYVETFQGLQLKYDQEKDRAKAANIERDEQAGIIHNATPIRKRRDDRVLDEYEESWFEHDEEEINHTVNEIESYSTKPLSAKLKDVDLIDTIPTPDSPPLQCMMNGSSSPLRNISNRPDSPTMRSKQSCSPEKKDEDANSPNNKISGSPPSSNNSGCFPLMKPIAAMNSKPVLNIVINSSLQNCNNTENDVSTGEKLNGASTNNTNTEKTVIESVVNHETIKPTDNQVSILATKTKPLLTSLVDYPDDDEESDGTDEEEVPSSPAKKQRIGST